MLFYYYIVQWKCYFFELTNLAQIWTCLQSSLGTIMCAKLPSEHLNVKLQLRVQVSNKSFTVFGN